MAVKQDPPCPPPQGGRGVYKEGPGRDRLAGAISTLTPAWTLSLRAGRYQAEEEGSRTLLPSPTGVGMQGGTWERAPRRGNLYPRSSMDPSPRAGRCQAEEEGGNRSNLVERNLDHQAIDLSTIDHKAWSHMVALQQPAIMLPPFRRQGRGAVTLMAASTDY